MSSLPEGTALASPGDALPVSRSALLGMALTLTTCALFALLDSATQFAGQWLSLALVVTALVLPRYGLAALRTAHPKFQAARVLFGISTPVCAFFCIQRMPLGNFAAIWSACPLLVAASAWLYQERVSPLRCLLLAWDAPVSCIGWPFEALNESVVRATE